MALLAPLALLGLVTIPIIVAFYMLRLRRPERTVSSTFLWQQLVRDVEANAPWQRLRRSLLLLLQLLLAFLLVMVVARPVTERQASLAHDIVLVVDASASMSATDVFPDRLTAAKQAAIDALKDLPSDGKVSVIAAAETARVVSNEATDQGRAARAIQSIKPTTSAGNLGDALKLAGALAARARGAEILVVTDVGGPAIARCGASSAAAASAAPSESAAPAGTATPTDGGTGTGACPLGSIPPIDAPIRVITIGTARDNQAIAALAIRADASGLKRTLFVSIANYSAQVVSRRLQILADGTPVSARDLELASLSRSDVVIDDLPPGARIVEAQLGTAQDASGQPIPSTLDKLAVDDRAWAVVPDDRIRRVLLVGPGNVYIQNAFSLLPNVELYGATADEWPTTSGKDRFDLFVFDGFLPDELPKAPILAIAPPKTSALGDVTGSLDNPIVAQTSPDEPLLAGVDLSRLHVAKTQVMTLPEWARTVIPNSPTVPLLYSGLRDGLPTAVLAFDLRDSDLPLQVAWPILVTNLAGELLGIDQAANDPIAPASPVELALRPGVVGLHVTLPDGSSTELTPGASGASSATFVSTTQLGIYRVEEIPDPSASPSPSLAPLASSSPDASASPGPSTAGIGAVTPAGPKLFAVDLFAAGESNINPGDPAALTALGSDQPVDQASLGLARDDWWPPLVLIVLAALMVEWLVYERDGGRRIWNGVRSGLRGGRPSVAGIRGGVAALHRPRPRAPHLHAPAIHAPRLRVPRLRPRRGAR
jgi:Ca-activated chloride channel homolog